MQVVYLYPKRLCCVTFGVSYQEKQDMKKNPPEG